VTYELAKAATLGGGVFGGGGGGSSEEGLRLASLALEMGHVEIVTLDEVPPEAVLLTVSAVGAPKSGVKVVAAHYIRAVQMLVQAEGLKLGGLITNECGGLACVNGWLQSAMLGVPVVDAPCNGRAHPTGVMGSMGLHRLKTYTSVQAAVGGDITKDTYLETLARGSLARASSLVRQASIQCGGLVAVARNPVTAAYAAKHAAPGALGRCMSLGRTMIEIRRKGRASMPETVAETLGGTLLVTGHIASLAIETKHGFDVGTVVVRGEKDVELTFWNEYACAEIGGRRVATFPDLIATLDAREGTALSTAEISLGQDVAVLVVPRARLILGAGMRDPALFVPIEQATGKAIAEHVSDEAR
jgi:DUF917 family protein